MKATGAPSVASGAGEALLARFEDEVAYLKAHQDYSHENAAEFLSMALNNMKAQRWFSSPALCEELEKLLARLLLIKASPDEQGGQTYINSMLVFSDRLRSAVASLTALSHSEIRYYLKALLLEQEFQAADYRNLALVSEKSMILARVIDGFYKRHSSEALAKLLGTYGMGLEAQVSGLFFSAPARIQASLGMIVASSIMQHQELIELLGELEAHEAMARENERHLLLLLGVLCDSKLSMFRVKYPQLSHEEAFVSLHILRLFMAESLEKRGLRATLFSLEEVLLSEDPATPLELMLYLEDPSYQEMPMSWWVPMLRSEGRMEVKTVGV